VHSKGFIGGFEKTAGVLSTLAAPVKAAGKFAVKALGGGANIAMTALGAGVEGAQGYKKLTDAAAR
jgi:hypothetical protein